MVVGGAIVLTGSPAFGQAPANDPIEVPLHVQDGRLVVTVDGPDGAKFDFVLGLGMTLITEGARTRMGESISALTLGGAPVETEQASTVPDDDAAVAGTGAAGVLGGLTLNKFDVLIDAPNERLVLKPIGRAVNWDGVSLTNPARMTVFHEVLARIDVEVGGAEYGGLLDLSAAHLEVNEPIRTAGGVEGDAAPSFRMGYSAWSDLPTKVTESPLFGGWDPNGNGFVIIGAPVAYDCAIAISWAHAEFRTCVR